MKKLLFAIALIAIGLTGKAQETVHDYAFVTYLPALRSVNVNTSTTGHEGSNLKDINGKDEEKDIPFFFGKVQSLESQGWTVMDTEVISNSLGIQYIWTLRKPKQ
jgi:hypothetical protein